MKYNISHLIQEENQSVLGPIQDDEALLLYSIIRVMRIHTVVEIGGLNGYSATNFLQSFTNSKDKLYTIDVNPVKKLSDNHIVIIKDCRLIDDKDISDKIDMVFFDAHVYNEQIVFYNNMVKLGLIDDNTIISLHDTNLHPNKITPDSYLVDGGWCHQPVERKLVNYFKDLGYDAINFHTNLNETTIPFRHGLTVLSKFRSLNV